MKKIIAIATLSAIYGLQLFSASTAAESTLEYAKCDARFAQHAELMCGK